MGEKPSNPSVNQALLQLAYAEMRAIAERLVGEAGDGALISPSSVVHLASMRLMAQRSPVRDARHMLSLSVIVMRRVLVDEARVRRAARRGGGLVLQLDAVDELADEPRFTDALALDEALTALAVTMPRAAEIVQGRVFGGLSVEEVAGALGLSAAQVKRDWSEGVAWLRARWIGDQPPSKPI